MGRVAAQSQVGPGPTGTNERSTTKFGRGSEAANAGSNTFSMPLLTTNRFVRP
jgi:hypothetical protein